ncbi:hypothetical protein A3C98_02410 [Candidatus Roizmanbacteria bacterium RIFCSPHIGHO2_02_FULL_37_15]|uniref:2'-5' RNA ligase n=1 Tax=Candidatus Roizmanbacteria bacterium RIFCSPLOWO2_01_FULL_37_16 TaxID=1802058 RepID=A0A1F7INP6_9BACT|nr:MAG: hypothetical protein A2859_02020 [Candidatus Roizmanbacteria bacterium RIFCSPHIGHO2_01_FULL_37_16b]OGK21428.1 MAG: hypothetical protein A3C98_02410 [Candidatus Roizmanbacteria bacterium RIFCSPHIGHO2_02_FULL_37_15]OGK32416.1 MAG: hypothetical protein A3F57_04935 [Candidatus Roizmanbacteria bacterium RIFCSPHIGHO2_12_FULL_36_11]OGK44961.1 MAG: hypothetical protein A3B40_04215 [Candidatus Roizmanbacteria bacterium RIFCSPLOWO2_01_FULL_37_16]OGK56789.1 MAG: hypothetical protein A3I50_05105 [C
MEIAYVILLDGELYNYTRRLQTNLSRLVNTKQALQLEPHITVKYGFEIKDISPFEKYFDQLVNSIHPFTIRLNKINYFEPNVAFLDIEKNKDLTNLHSNILEFLDKNHSIKPSEFEGPSFHFHTTLAYKDLSSEDFIKVKNYLKNESPNYKYSVSKMAIYILLSQEDKWFIYKIGSLK